MEDERVGDVCVPLISSFFCLCVLTGGIFLILYIFFPYLSQPWFPIPALLLIGTPWIFWLFTYIYTCIKACCVPRRPQGPQNNKTISTARRTVDNTQQVSVASSRDSESPLNAASV